MQTVSTRNLVFLLAVLSLLAACNRGYKPYETADTGVDSPASDPFRAAFAVDKSKLQSTGTNLFFPLQPGTVSTFKDGEESLTIAVLEETRRIDGVECRVVEEREETQAGLKEISRNFFACDPDTGDVYYFGEEVDLYKNGRIVGHEGAWKSGEKGAHFGLMMPGVLSLGDRFYQERAPGVALDRCEVVAIDEQIQTPAGTFTSAVRLLESTPLERGTGTKVFAPNVGLVKDGGMVLFSRTPS